MIRHERIIRGVPLWLLREYLQEIGGKMESDEIVVGDGWIARTTSVEPFHVGSLCLGQVRLELEGNSEVLAVLLPALEKKTMRAGA
jgi:hypothetical protein